MSILIIGANGNMGLRYQAILKHLGKPFVGVDKECSPRQARKIAKHSDAVIIASPTHSHISYLYALHDLKKPVLCEKPFTKDVRELSDFVNKASPEDPNISMVYQYKELASKRRGPSSYNYFKHGGDGLIWDCIQVIGLARDAVTLQEDSPVWKCQINGLNLRIADMDHAYVSFIEKWLSGEKQRLGDILDIHQKTYEMEKASQ